MTHTPQELADALEGSADTALSFENVELICKALRAYALSEKTEITISSGGSGGPPEHASQALHPADRDQGIIRYPACSKKGHMREGPRGDVTAVNLQTAATEGRDGDAYSGEDLNRVLPAQASAFSSDKEHLSSRLNNAAEGCLSLGYGTELYDLLKEAAAQMNIPARSLTQAQIMKVMDEVRAHGHTMSNTVILGLLVADGYLDTVPSARGEHERALADALKLVLDDWANANAVGDDARARAEKALDDFRQYVKDKS